MPLPSAKCPLRPGDPCSLCVPGASGPQDCPTVRLVLEDPELRELWLESKRAAATRQPSPEPKS